jgi:hypothetical protein
MTEHILGGNVEKLLPQDENNLAAASGRHPKGNLLYPSGFGKAGNNSV